MELIYSLRNARGPHDVPPPEPLRGKMSVTYCLPLYCDYLEILILLENNLRKDFQSFVSAFSDLTEFTINLAFGKENERITIDRLLRDVLYRDGFFGSEGKRLAEVQAKLKTIGYIYTDPVVSQALLKLAKGKGAVLTRKGKMGRYLYCERCPPQEVFKVAI